MLWAVRTSALLVLAGAAVWAQTMPQRGSLLIATDRTRDSAFAQTVVLMLIQDAQRSVGLVINRPLGAPVSNLFPDLKAGRDEPLWAGGPVEIGVHALVRSATKPADGAKIVDNVWLIADRARIRQLGGRPGVRIYIGLCSWGAGQLADELGRRLWKVAPGDAGILFDPRPETLWTRLSASR